MSDTAVWIVTAVATVVLAILASRQNKRIDRENRERFGEMFRAPEDKKPKR